MKSAMMQLCLQALNEHQQNILRLLQQQQQRQQQAIQLQQQLQQQQRLAQLQAQAQQQVLLPCIRSCTASAAGDRGYQTYAWVH